MDSMELKYFTQCEHRRLLPYLDFTESDFGARLNVK